MLYHDNPTRKNLLAIDPGLQGTGWAVWEGRNIAPREVGVLRGPSGPNWMKRVDVIAEALSQIVQQYRVRHIICEQMELYATASSSMSWIKGDLQRTVFLIGTIHGLTRLRARMTLVTPREWKGQLPKSVTIDRVRKVLGQKSCRDLDISTHAWDAVGIGLWHQGAIK